ncbi:MAG TPA: FHA domain-containing protein [Candidatus Stackebrandtia faecavium]|nr:FHA domain-containing protein [Candidatus Stackebrandtia faecavium]
MPELVFTVARFGLLVLLWVFVFVIARTIRHDVFAGGGSGAAASGKSRNRPVGRPQQQQQQAQSARQLVVTAGDRQGTQIPLTNNPITIGRSPQSTLVINDDYASARHAQISPRRGQWVVEDVGSTNGTYLGRAKVSAPTPVPLGVPIRIGRTSIELRP